MTCEALYHLLGGKAAGWVPYRVSHEGAVHWYLVLRFGRRRRRYGLEVTFGGRVVLDPTRAQFKSPPPYDLGRGCGFLTKRPSKRARALMKTLVWQEVSK